MALPVKVAAEGWECGRLLQGDPIAIDGIRMSPATLLTELNKVAGDNGAWRWLQPHRRTSCSSSGKICTARGLCDKQ
jgi:hypothetical protein